VSTKPGQLQFALDLALVRAIDSLDTYMMRSRRRPFALTNDSFASALDGTGQKISKRLEVFNTYLEPLPTHHSAFIRLAIDWRNRRVHSLAEDIAEGEDIEALQQCSDGLREEFSGLIVEELIRRYKNGLAPTFKEAAAIIRLTHVAVTHFDEQLLRHLGIRRYLSDALAMHLGGHGGAINISSPSHSCRQLWDHPIKREAKVLRALRLIGIHPTDELKGRAVPDDLIDDLLRMTSANAIDFLRQPAS
jgi:hypothetical protein